MQFPAVNQDVRSPACFPGSRLTQHTCVLTEARVPLFAVSFTDFSLSVSKGKRHDATMTDVAVTPRHQLNVELGAAGSFASSSTCLLSIERQDQSSSDLLRSRAESLSSGVPVETEAQSTGFNSHIQLRRSFKWSSEASSELHQNTLLDNLEKLQKPQTNILKKLW